MNLPMCVAIDSATLSMVEESPLVAALSWCWLIVWRRRRPNTSWDCWQRTSDRCRWADFSKANIKATCMEHGSSALGRMPDSQSSEPGFESRFVAVSNIGHFRSLHWRLCSLSCINEYLTIDSGGNVSDLALARNCCLARMLPGEAELVSEWTGLSGEAKSVKRFERSKGLDTALYKNYLYLFFNIEWYTPITVYQTAALYNIKI